MFWWRKHHERDLERELRSDLELKAAEQQANGLTPEKQRTPPCSVFTGCSRLPLRNESAAQLGAVYSQALIWRGIP